MESHRPPDPDAARAKFAVARSELAAALVERDDEVDLLLTALVAGEHALLVGPPGCAKSLLLDSLLALCGGSKFSVLLTKFTTPEEVVGPVSLAAIKEDKYLRVTAGKLPAAEFAFLDEVFRGSGAILNTLLKLLNERTYDPGDGVARAVPLRLCVGASNAWPDPESARELHALSDRFLLRKEVEPVRSRAGRQRLLWSGGTPPHFAATVSPSDLDCARAAAAALPWSPGAKDALEAVLDELRREGVRPGDRRQVKAVGAARAAAYLAGAGEVEPEHLEVLRHPLWDDPEGQPAVAARVVAKVANPPGMRAAMLLAEADGLSASVDPRDLAAAATAAAKLAEVGRRLAELKSCPRVEAARSHVRDQIRELKLASIAAV